MTNWWRVECQYCKTSFDHSGHLLWHLPKCDDRTKFLERLKQPKS